MKTLLFNLMYIDNQWCLDRHNKWIDFYKNVPDLIYDEILFVDNASDKTLKAQTKKLHPSQNEIFCSTRLERLSHMAYGYWYRAFKIGLNYAIENGYDNVVHLDTDVYLLNPKICQYINNINSGWTTFWSHKYGMPESSMQIIGKDMLKTGLDFFTDGFLTYYPYAIAEVKIPWTHIEKNFVGDRYGEQRQQQTPDMDYYCQANPETKITYQMDKS